jgi:two-component system, LuxR family, sensor kinase FixL
MTHALAFGAGLLIAGAIALLAILALRLRFRAGSAEIVKANRRFRATFDQLAVGLAHLDPQGRWLRVNDRFCEIAGYSRDELMAKTIDEITHPDDLALDREGRDAMTSGALDRSTSEKRYVRKDGAIAWVNITRSTVRGADGRPDFIVTVAEDVTSRKAAEARLLASEERLRLLQNEFAHLARTNDLGEMASAIGHEINQPLTAIVNYLNTGLYIAREGYSEAGFAEAAEAMQHASDQALRAGDIVRRLRDFIGQGDGVRSVEPVEALVDSAMALALIGARSSGVAVEREAGVGDAEVQVDTVQIQQALVNLLRNAVEAMGPAPRARRARLTISTRNGPNDSVEIRVADTGPGVAPEIANRLFEPFVTTKETGMGMGLSVSRRLIEAHGGSIETDANPGGGAAFTLRLPRFRPAAGP